MRTSIAVGVVLVVVIGVVAFLVTVGSGLRDSYDAAASEAEVPTGAQTAANAARGNAAPDSEPARPGGSRPMPSDPEALDEATRAKLRPLLETIERIRQRQREADSDPRDDEARGPEAESETPERYAANKEGILAAINSAIPQVKECYEGWLNANPTLEGKIVADFTIAADEEEPSTARIVEAKVKEGGLGNEFLDGCILASFGELTFEPPEDGEMKVTYPFVFRTSNNAETPEPGEAP